MSRHRLLLYDRIGRRPRALLLWLIVALLALGVVDWYTAFLGEAWVWLWIALAPAVGLWLYYAFGLRRAAVHVRRGAIRLQGPLFGLNFSYGRIRSVTVVNMGQHYAFKALSARERRLYRPLYQKTAVFVELRSAPSAFARRQLWFPLYLFGTVRPGLLLVVDDWMALSQAISTAQSDWLRVREQARRGDTRSLAARVLALDD